MHEELLALVYEIAGRLSEVQEKVQNMVNRLSEENPGTPVVAPSPSGQSLGMRPRSIGNITVTPVSSETVTLRNLPKGDYRNSIVERVGFPDGTQKRARTWKEVVIEIVKYHVQQGYISGDTPPTGEKRRYPVVSRDIEALSPSNRRQASNIANVDGWFIDTYGSASGVKARNLISICGSSGTDPSQFTVTLIPVRPVR